VNGEPYFAYGSNLLVGRLTERIPGASRHGIGSLQDHRLVCDKAGRDGSAKANLRPHAGAVVWGALYTLPSGGLDRLDPFEGGYRRAEVGILIRTGEIVRAVTYLSDRRTDDPTPFDWYRAMILEGARSHDLPEDYLALLEALPFRRDPREPGAR